MINQLENKYLFDSLHGQHNRVLVTHANAIFNANTNTAEMLRPSLIIGNIDTTNTCQLRTLFRSAQKDIRLNGDALSGLQVDTSWVTSTVMHVESNIVAQMMRK